MAITFHCDHCGRKIEAPKKAAGKWGKCPACKNKVYVPDLTEEPDLKLAPVDEEEEERKKKLLAETYALQQDILQEKEIPDDEKGPVSVSGGSGRRALSEEDLHKRIVKCLHQMAEGNLEGAEQTKADIVGYGEQSLRILDRLALDEVPHPNLQDIPPQVLSGLIRNLRSEVGQ
jgi:hypothetical protein